MLDPQPTLVQRLVRHVLLPRAFLAAGCLGRHEDLHLGQREGQKAQILQEPAPRGQGIRGRIGNRLLMDAAAVGVAQQEDREEGMDEQDIFDGVVLCLAAIAPRLFHRILGADDAPFGAAQPATFLLRVPLPSVHNHPFPTSRKPWDFRGVLYLSGI
jgi:hypothetical protein